MRLAQAIRRIEEHPGTADDGRTTESPDLDEAAIEQQMQCRTEPVGAQVEAAPGSQLFPGQHVESSGRSATNSVSHIVYIVFSRITGLTGGEHAEELIEVPEPDLTSAFEDFDVKIALPSFDGVENARNAGNMLSALCSLAADVSQRSALRHVRLDVVIDVLEQSRSWIGKPNGVARLGRGAADVGLPEHFFAN